MPLSTPRMTGSSAADLSIDGSRTDSPFGRLSDRSRGHRLCGLRTSRGGENEAAAGGRRDRRSGYARDLSCVRSSRCRSQCIELRQREDGQTTTEYAILLGFLAIAIIIALFFLRTVLRNLFSDAAASVSDAGGPRGPTPASDSSAINRRAARRPGYPLDRAGAHSPKAGVARSTGSVSRRGEFLYRRRVKPKV